MGGLCITTERWTNGYLHFLEFFLSELLDERGDSRIKLNSRGDINECNFNVPKTVKKKKIMYQIVNGFFL